MSDSAVDVDSLDQLEYVMTSRLAGESLANALFIADASLAEALKGTTSTTTSTSIKNARLAIARAARSGLVLLTSAKPGSEPIDQVDLAERLALAGSMIHRLMPQGPRVKVFKTEQERVYARVPVSLPARLLIRVIACFPDAQEIEVDVEHRVDKGLDVAQLHFKSDATLSRKWLPRLEELLDTTAGNLLADENSIRHFLPACWDIRSDELNSDQFLAERGASMKPKPPRET